MTSKGKTLSWIQRVVIVLVIVLAVVLGIVVLPSIQPVSEPNNHAQAQPPPEVVRDALEANITVVAPEVAARSSGGWISWPAKEDMAEKFGHWAVYLYPIKDNGSPIRTDPAQLKAQDDIFSRHYPPIKGMGDGWMTVRQRWFVGNQLCEARYYRRTEFAFAPDRLMNMVKSEVVIEPAPSTN
jgi:hypothetical protein